MKGLKFPIIGTKISGQKDKFDLSSPAGRQAYFEAKVGDEIKHIKEYLKDKNFMAFLVGKKNSGKGTYAKLFTEIFGEDKAVHLSVGDLVREVHANWAEFEKSSDFAKLKKIYRGYISLEEAIKILHGRSTATLLPTEFILALLKVRIEKLGGKSIFIDGLPREADQVSYSLFFRDLAGYTEAPDFFILIDVPESVIDERIKYRVVCPICHTSRNTKLLLTSKVEYDDKKRQFYLICDNPDCQ
jgi:adenylate kinase family enzyme